MNEDKNRKPNVNEFKGKDPGLMKPAKMSGSQSGTGPRKQSTKND